MLEEEITKDGKQYRLVTLRNRSKYVAKDGSAINPYRPNQKVTIHYNADGYPCFGGGIPVHLYVAHGWVDGYKDGLEVDHIDFNKNNFNASNLRWINHTNNVKHSVKDNSTVWNTSKQGENNGRATLTIDDVKSIRRWYSKGYKISEITAFMNTTYGIVFNIVHYRTWKNI